MLTLFNKPFLCRFFFFFTFSFSSSLPSLALIPFSISSPLFLHPPLSSSCSTSHNALLSQPSAPSLPSFHPPFISPSLSSFFPLHLTSSQPPPPLPHPRAHSIHFLVLPLFSGLSRSLFTRSPSSTWLAPSAASQARCSPLPTAEDSEALGTKSLSLQVSVTVDHGVVFWGGRRAEQKRERKKVQERVKKKYGE